MMRILPLLIFGLLAIAGCKPENDIVPKPYPYVVISSGTADSNGISVKARVESEGSKEIIEYGFVWSESEHPTILNNKKVIGEQFTTGPFETLLSRGIGLNQQYFIRAFAKTADYLVYSNDISIIGQGSPKPIITKFFPTYGPIGTEITLTGRNFSPEVTGNTIKIGEHVAVIKALTDTTITFQVPKVTNPESAYITVETNAGIGTSKDLFDIWFPWRSMNEFSEPNFVYSLSFSINGKGYICIGFYYSNLFLDLWEYDPLADKWTQKSTFPGAYRNFGTAFSVNGKGYIMLGENLNGPGFNYFSEVWEYDPVADQWARKADFPGLARMQATSMTIAGKAYIGLGKNFSTQGTYLMDFWEYNPISDSWTEIAPFPGHRREAVMACSAGGYGFVGIGGDGWPQKDIFRYDPRDNSWKMVTSYPGKGYGYQAVTTIGDKCYIGLGSDFSGHKFNDFWEYNPADNTWKQMQSCNTAMITSMAFTANNKAYIGMGWEVDNNRIIYEFDPAKN